MTYVSSALIPLLSCVTIQQAVWGGQFLPFCTLRTFIFLYVCQTNFLSFLVFFCLILFSFFQAGGPRHLLQDKPHHNHVNGFLIHLSPSPIHFILPLLAMALLSWSLLSAATDVFDPLTLDFLPGEDVHISMYSMVLVLCSMCMCACCSPLVQVCLADPLPNISPWNLLKPPPQTPHQISHYPHLLLLHKIRSAVVLPYSFQNAAWHISCFYCMGVRVCSVCACVGFVCMYTGEGLICLYVG